jgi:hypothetical protein
MPSNANSSCWVAWGHSSSRATREIDWGCSDLGRIEIVGSPLPATPCLDFEWAKPIPVKFSLGRVCRSITRQIALLVRDSRTNGGSAQ